MRDDCSVATSGDGSERGWTLLTNHGRILLLIARYPDSRIRDLAAAAGITERSIQMLVTDLEAAIDDFSAWGCRPGLRGHLDAAASAALYGHDSALESVQLLHGDADHGLVRLMKWQTPLVSFKKKDEHLN